MSVRLVIIGGVAGGMSAATRARRLSEGASINVLEAGGHISVATCGLPYLLDGRIASKENLLITTPRRAWERYRITARVHHEVTRIDREHKQVEGVDHSTGRKFAAPYDKLIIATGAQPIVPAVPGAGSANVFTLRSIEDALAVEDWIMKQKAARAVVIGAGFIGLEVAETLRKRGLAVTVLEKAPHALPVLDREIAARVGEELAKNNIDLRCGSGLKSVNARHGVAFQVETEDGKPIDADLVIMSVGVRPDVALARAAGLRIGPSGAIAVDQYQRTSEPDVYAIGDASEGVHAVTAAQVRVALAGPANRQGRVAGSHAVGGPARPTAKVLGTAIVKVFDLTVAVTGLGEAAARQAGFDADSAMIQAPHHASYYPGAEPMRIKLIYDAPSGVVLGAQIAGGAGVDKRIDVVATAMYFSGTVADLGALDLAYAPPFSSARDPIQVAAAVAQNQRDGVMPAVAPAALNGELLLDVRMPEESSRGTLADAVNIPLDALRDRMAELDTTKSIVTMCQAGQRGYVAQRILVQHGFKKVKNLKGGFSVAKDGTTRNITGGQN